MNHWPFPYKTLDGLNNFGSGGTGGTVTSVSASVPAWLSVTVTNPTTTPNIAISGTSTGTGSVTVLQDSPTLNNVVTITDQLHIPRNSGTGHAIKITNAHAGIQDNYIEIGKNSSGGNHAHYGHYYVGNNDPLNHAFIYTDSYFVKFYGGTDFTFPKIAPASIDQLLVGNPAGEATWTTTLAAPGGYTFNSPVYLNSTFVVSSLQVNGSFSVIQNVASGIIGTFTNDTTNTLVHNYVQIGSSNSSAMNRARFGHYFAGVNNSANYAFIQTNGRRLMFAGLANFTLPVTEGTNGQSLITDGSGVTSWADRVVSVSGSSPISSSGGTNPTISLSTVPTTLGGTGLTTVGTNGQVLTSNGTSLTWSTPTTGTLTAVTASSPINSSGGNTPNISLSTVPTSLGGTGLTTVGTNGQVLASNGSTLQYVTLPTPVTSVAASTPLSSSGGTTPTISLSTVPTTLGGTGLTTVGTNGQVLASNGTTLQYVTLATPVTSVTATSPIVSSGGTTPDLSLSTVPTTLGGTGLTTVGTNGQVLTSNGTSLTWTTPTTGTVTSVAATSPLASSGGATPTISIASSTGTGAVALQTAPSFINSVTITHPTQAQLTLLAGTVPSLANISDINLNTIGGGGGTISQYIRAAYDATFGYYISINPNGDFLSNGSRNVFPNNVLIGGTNGQSKLNIGDGAMDAALYGSVQITQTDVTNTKASIAFVRNGHFVHGMGYLTGTSTFGFGAASISSFNPAFLSITSSGTIGIGTTTPAYDLDINKPIGSAISFAVRDGFSAGFRTQWNYSGGQGETVFWDYRGAGSGGFWFKNLNTGNTDAGWAPINCGYTVINNNGETLVLEGTDHTYIRFRYNSINRGFLGYSSANTNGLAIVNTMAGGDIYLYTPNEIISDANHKIVGLLKLGNSLSLGPNPSTSAFTFRFPASMGTSGQVLTTDGTNTYWSTSGGGGGGSVNSVTASAPLASSGGTAPNISIASATGSGAVVLATSPTISDNLLISRSIDCRVECKPESSGAAGVEIRAVGNSAYLDLTSKLPSPGADYDFRLIRTSGSPHVQFLMDASLTGGYIIDRFIQATGNSNFIGDLYASGNVGIGTTSPSLKLHVVQSASSDSVQIQNTNANGNANINYVSTTHTVSMGLGGTSTGTLANKFFCFFNGATRYVIDTSGRFGIGTTAPTEKLHLVGNSLFEQAAINQDVLMKFSVTNNLSGTVTYINTMYTAAANGNFVIETTGGYRDVIVASQALYLQNAALGGGAGVLALWDGNHSIYGRYNQFGADVGSMNYHAFGDHVWWNNGARPVQSQKMRLNTSGRLSTLGFSTNNFTDVFTYEELSFTPTMGCLNAGSSGTHGPFVVEAALQMQPGTWFFAGTGRLTRIGRIVTISVDVQYDYRWDGSIAPFGTNYICIVLPAIARPSLLAGIGCASFPNNLSGISNPLGYLTGNCTYGPLGEPKAYLTPTTPTANISWNLVSYLTAQRLLFTATYNI